MEKFYDQALRVNKLACKCSVAVNVCVRNNGRKLMSTGLRLLYVKCPMVHFSVNISGHKTIILLALNV
jgi:hypothetical protein